MLRLLTAVLFGFSLVACHGYAQPTTVHDIPPTPLAPERDPVQQIQTESTVDGLVVSLSIDGTTVHLDNAILARIPRPTSRGDANDRERVTVVGFAGGQRLSDVSAPDAVVNASEEGGIVRLTRRQVVLLIAAPRALDTIEVTAPATGARARLDVRDAYAPYCPNFNPDNRYCPQPRSEL